MAAELLHAPVGETIELERLLAEFDPILDEAALEMQIDWTGAIELVQTPQAYECGVLGIAAQGMLHALALRQVNGGIV